MSGTQRVAVPINDFAALNAKGLFTTVWYRFFQAVALFEVQIGDCLVQAVGPVNSGWLQCNGQAVSRIAYADLFRVLGVTYGPGDGLTTFNLPNFASPGGASFWKIAFE